MFTKRVVVTGLGVVAPNGIGVPEFIAHIRKGKSGITAIEAMKALDFRCQVAGLPPLSEEVKREFCDRHRIRKLESTGILYGLLAGLEAWSDAGLDDFLDADTPNWDTGCIFGSGMTGVEGLDLAIPLIKEGLFRKLSTKIVQQTMSSGISAYLGGLLRIGNQLTTNASACATGSAAILSGFERIRSGLADRMLTGACDSASVYIWGSFDAMRVLNGKSNHDPAGASRPMSASAGGFVPGAGAGALLLESLASAQSRGARIYAELLGGAENCGGQLQGGSMTAPNQNGVIRCIRTALQRSRVEPEEVDAVCGHLTATMGDPLEVASIAQALGRSREDFPYINATKSMIGHCLSATGAIESVAAVKQLQENFFHASLNCEDVHPAIEATVGEGKIPHQTLVDTDFRIMLKNSFGFGDVNTCLVFKKWELSN